MSNGGGVAATEAAGTIHGPAELLDPVLDLVLRRVRLRARRRSAWLRKLWAKEGEPGGRVAVTHAEMDTHLAGLDSPEAEAEWLSEDPSVAGWDRELADVEAALGASARSPLGQLARIFGLSPEDRDIFHTCLAELLDPALSRVYAYLHDHAGRAYVSADLVARLFGHGRTGLWQGASALARWELVTENGGAPGEPPQLACDPWIRDWLQGRHALDPSLVGVAAIHPPSKPLVGWPINETAELLERIAFGETANQVRVQVAGPPGSGRRTLSAAIAARLGLGLLAVDSSRATAGEWHRVYLRTQRQAYLDGLVPAWSGETALEQHWSRRVTPFPIQFVILDTGQTLLPHPEMIEHRIQVPPLGLAERRRLWLDHVPGASSWPEGTLLDLARRHRVTVGQIATVGRQGPGSPDDAVRLVRETERRSLGKLAQLLECPFTRDDLVLSEGLREALEDLVFEARERLEFWERPEARRLFPQGRGLLSLFTGKPGTGKTMAAQVIAAELGLDLFRIDLSAVVSKYVGETSQNLERILSRASEMDVVLLFDEADALFGKRTEVKDAHDRFANTDTSYLLQAIESFPGLALLATNRKNNIDSAFIRRLRYVLEFPRPTAAQRLRIWRQVVGDLAGSERLEALAETLKKLADGLVLSGAQIKFAVLTAIFVAQRQQRPLALLHLMRGVERELLKEGRTLNEREQHLKNEGRTEAERKEALQ